MKKLIIVLTMTLLIPTVSPAQNGERQWTGTWACAPQYAGKDNMPKSGSMDGCSVRQIVHASIGGDTVRLLLSNEYSAEPVEIKSVYIATAKDSCDIDARTARYLTFNGGRGAMIAPGKALFSDAVRFPLTALQKVAITVSYGSTPAVATAHNGSRTTSYIIKGETGPKSKFAKSMREDHWYNIAALDVKGAEHGCVAVLGNSITDGRGSTTNMQNRWTDVMAEELHGRSCVTGVLNLGIGGNLVLGSGLGDPAVKRFERDIMGQRGVEKVIVFEGVNDIGTSDDAVATAAQLIGAYRKFIARAHEKGLKVYGATITPFKGHYYYSRDHETGRRMVNLWIRESGAFDGVIDFDKAVRDPADESALRKDLHEDGLHLNPAGYRLMGKYAAEVLGEK